jgi:quercetin dioxygenase-like cupin family protein
MKQQNFHYALVIAVGLVSSFGFWASSAQESPPVATEGLDTLKTEFVDLGPEIEGLQGRQLRLRLLSLEPGGQIGLHSHRDRPAVAYVIEGTTTVTFEDGTVKRFSAGSTISANRNTTHWHRNDEKEPALFVTVDVFNTAK